MDAQFRMFLDSYRERLPESQRAYLDSHYRRFLYTLREIPEAQHGSAAAMELGTYGTFLLALRDLFGYQRIEGTIYEDPGSEAVSFLRRYGFDPLGGEFMVHNIDLERTSLPIADESFDLLVAAELAEHFATDPNHFFFEANRILKMGGRLLLTTPNVACAENIFRILWRQVPHRYYYFRKDGTRDRHNLEYGPDLLKKTVENAGFAVERMSAEDCWSEPRPDILKFIRDAGFPDDFRGDDMIFLCIKTALPHERFPDFLYT